MADTTQSQTDIDRPEAPTGEVPSRRAPQRGADGSPRSAPEMPSAEAGEDRSARAPIRFQLGEYETAAKHRATIDSIGTDGRLYGRVPGAFTATWWHPDGTHNQFRDFDLMRPGPSTSAAPDAPRDEAPHGPEPQEERANPHAPPDGTPAGPTHAKPGDAIPPPKTPASNDPQPAPLSGPRSAQAGPPKAPGGDARTPAVQDEAAGKARPQPPAALAAQDEPWPGAQTEAGAVEPAFEARHNIETATVTVHHTRPAIRITLGGPIGGLLQQAAAAAKETKAANAAAIAAANAPRPQNAPAPATAATFAPQNQKTQPPPAAHQGQPAGTAPQGFGKTLARFQNNRMDPRSLDHLAQEAKDALDNFIKKEGRQIINRIHDAAKTDPDGLRGVLSEMKEGGRYQDLREAFNLALTHSQSFKDSYERAAEALQQWGKRRAGANIPPFRHGLDEDIVSQAAAIPSKDDGESLIDRLKDNARDFAKRMADRLERLIRGTPEPSPNASPGPSP